MEKHKILGLTLLGAGTAATGLGIYGTVQALQLNNQTSDTKAKESKAMNNVIDTVYGSTESDAKAMGTASGLLAGAAAAGGLILLTTGGLLLSPLGIKMKQIKLAKIGAISLAVIAGGAPVLGAVGTGLFYTDQVQQAKQFLDFSADFEKEFMGNINAVETSARDMLEEAGWLEFSKLLEEVKTNADALKIDDKYKNAGHDQDLDSYYRHYYLVAANMYVLGGKSLIDGFGGLQPALHTTNYMKGFFDTPDGKYKFYADKLEELIAKRDKFGSNKLDISEIDAVKNAAKKSVEWFKNTMKKYNSNFGVDATDQVVALTLAKLGYVSGNKNLSTEVGSLNTDGSVKDISPEATKASVTKFLIPDKLAHFANVPGLILDNKNFKLKEELKETIGIDELVNKYKENWKQDPLKYIFTEQGAGRDVLDEVALNSSTNTHINKAWLSSYFAIGKKLFIDNANKITDFSGLDFDVTVALPTTLMPPAASLATGKTISQIFTQTFGTIIGGLSNHELVQTKSSYFLQMKLTLAKNYVQSVMNEISDTLTNHATDIYA